MAISRVIISFFDEFYRYNIAIRRNVDMNLYLFE